jgi:hypothetical protein
MERFQEVPQLLIQTRILVAGAMRSAAAGRGNSLGCAGLSEVSSHIPLESHDITGI